MCLVLAPDIIVAAELGEKRAWNESDNVMDYTITISECLEKQKRLSRVGLGNVIAEVDELQIKDFLEQSDVFDYYEAGKYKLSEKKWEDWAHSKEHCSEITDKVGEFLRQIVLCKAYPSKMLRALSIIK